MGSVVIIDLNEFGVSECHICGKTSVNKGIPIYEGLVLPNEWEGEWGGVPACDKCHKEQNRLTQPINIETFRHLNKILHNYI